MKIPREIENELNIYKSNEEVRKCISQLQKSLED